MRIDPETGELVLTSPLDYETNSVYDFTVVAINDAGGVIFNDTSSVIFEVLDSNDNSPVFEESVYYTSVNEGNYTLSPTPLTVEVCEVWECEG